MYESCAGIKFTGAAFKHSTEMLFFPNAQNRACLIYGENGSGKSTLSKAFLKVRGIDVPEITLAQVVNNIKDKNEIVLTEEEKQHIFVFNEDYIEKNIRLKEEGLSTIVMFGEQGELEEKIEQAITLYETADTAYQAQKESYSKFEDASLITSPAYHIAKMKAALQGDAHWAGRERLISKFGRQNAAVRNNTYIDIVKNTPTESVDELSELFEQNLKLLQTATDDTKKIMCPVPVDISFRHSESEIVDALAIKLEKPELSEREVYLLKLAEAGKTSYLEKIQNTFSNSSTITCPFCLQPVNEKYKSTLVSSIQKILNKAVEEHRDLLRELILPKITFDFEPFLELDNTVLQSCKDALSQLNAEIDKSNTLLTEKIESVYTPITDHPLSLDKKIHIYIESLNKLEDAKKLYNHQFEGVNELRNVLHKINTKLSYYDIIDLYNTYRNQKNLMEESKQRLEQLAQASKNMKRNLDKLLQQKKNIRVAVDEINRGLQYVFFSKKRLHIEAADNIYTLASNGSMVHPSDISSGERNVIALCYFFVDILRNLEKEKAYKQPCFLVIDDPVSSFDLENRIGILSFLKAKLLKVFCGSVESKAIVMTHDLPTFYDLEKVFGEIKNAAAIEFGKNTSNYKLLELTNKQICDFPEKKRHEYTELLSTVYEYAAGISTEYDMVIGNVMRRVLEAFATFEYKKGIDTISCDENILSSLGNPVYHDYFQNLMYRLLLNGESHMEERVKSLTDPTLASSATEENKTKAAKDVLCMIYLLNPAHVKAHLENEKGAVDNIKTWCEEIINTNS